MLELSPEHVRKAVIGKEKETKIEVADALIRNGFRSTRIAQAKAAGEGGTRAITKSQGLAAYFRRPLPSLLRLHRSLRLSWPSAVHEMEVAMHPRGCICSLAVVLALLGGAAGTSRAQFQVPSPSACSVPAFVTTTSGGTDYFQVIVRDQSNTPIAGSTVVVDFNTCGASLCASQPPGQTLNGNKIIVTTNASGVALFSICGTLSGPPCTTTISADGTTLGNRPGVQADVGYTETSYPTAYAGVHNTSQLASFLSTSNDPAIQSLSQATKTSLVNALVFLNGLPRGVVTADANIDSLYAHTSQAASVFSAIFAQSVVMRTGAIGKTMLFPNYIANDNGSGTPPSYCENCYIPGGGYECCLVGGNGCCDYIAVVNNIQYRLLVGSPVALAGGNRTILPGGSTQLGHAPSAGYTYLWSPASGLSATNIANPIASPSTTTTYTLITFARPEVADSSHVTVTVGTPSAPGMSQAGVAFLAGLLLVAGLASCLKGRPLA